MKSKMGLFVGLQRCVILLQPRQGVSDDVILTVYHIHGRLQSVQFVGHPGQNKDESND